MFRSFGWPELVIMLGAVLVAVLVIATIVFTLTRLVIGNRRKGSARSQGKFPDNRVQMTGTFCRNCGASNPGNAKFCSKCGQPMNDKSA